ncbi:MAG: polyphosphate polymerase domain-containing protein [Lachnospiraceae bacterium]|nr:polyphosphate polymerase domain-containing protein [Lachnospiraceae bacterium]
MTAFRHEDKYLIDAAQERILRMRAEAYFFRDPHAGEDGCYDISSLYFDDPDNSCFHDNEDGIGNRDKYRIRVYNEDDGLIRLEKKEKRKNLTRKVSSVISREQALSLMQGELTESEPGQDDTASLLFEEMWTKLMRPKVIVSYKRASFIYPAGNVRLTFDQMVESSGEVQAFLKGGYRSRPVLPDGMCIMELKWDELLPRHLIEGLQPESMHLTKFSKYYACRKWSII